MARLLNMRPDDEVEPPLTAHLLHLKKENQRPRSIRERRLTVLRVARFLGHSVSTASKDELVAWQDSRVGVLEPASMHNEIVHVACYLRWMLDTERRADDVGRVLVRPKKVNQSEPHPISESNLRRATLAADDEMVAWLRLGSESGLRCMEIAKVGTDDIGDMLRVVGKGNKERRTVISAGLRELLLTGPFNRDGHLFNRMDGNPGPPSALRVSERINDHLHNLGISDTAHSLRHRFGTEMYRLCRDPFKVASYMGHASVDTTRGYVRLVDDNSSELAEALAALGVAS